MRFEPLTSPAADEGALREEHAGARRIGKLRLGDSRLYLRAGLKVYYIPYADIRRYFRRVMMVPAKLCCGHGELRIEHLVICGEGGELAQVQLPGTNAAQVVMELMAQRAPQAAAGRPGAQDAAAQEATAAQNAGE